MTQEFTDKEIEEMTVEHTIELEQEEMKTQIIEILKKIEHIGKSEKIYPLIYNLKELQKTNSQLFRKSFLEMENNKSLKFLCSICLGKEDLGQGWIEYIKNRKNKK